MNIVRNVTEAVGVPGATGLGLIPSYLFSSDPSVNPSINPHVTYPPGVTQMTPQPLGPYYGMSGLGTTSSKATVGGVLWGLLATVSSGVSAYHGYKRNNSVGWAVGWALLGGMFPVITPAVAVAQGFGKRKK